MPIVVLFGSFIELNCFKDIDITVYLRSTDLDHLYKLASRLEEELGLPVDVVPLNDLPPRFRHRVLAEGHVILEGQPGLHETLIMQALDEVALLEVEEKWRELSISV